MKEEKKDDLVTIKKQDFIFLLKHVKDYASFLKESHRVSEDFKAFLSIRIKEIEENKSK
jgi:hypothetical protein